ncbi:MAG: LCP family protein [Lachnospiraceae bacterium]|nr:LCP family protein [Lachnospiraceae bacterium]
MGRRRDRHSRVNAVIAVVVAIAAVIAIFLLFDGLSRRNLKRDNDSASADATTESVTKDPVITLGIGDYTYKDDITNYLIIGTDHSGSYGKAEKSGDDYHGEMADFLLIVSVDDTKGTYTLLPIDRDTMTDVPLMGTDGSTNASAREQICTAHWYGGNEEQSCRNTVKTVSKYLGGLPIKGYYCLGMDSIKEINHSVDGVTVTVHGDFTGIDDSLVEGQTIRLSDDQAFTYVHERMNMPDDNTNSARMQRQQDFMDGFMKASKEELKENPSFANDLYDDLMEDSVTNMTGHDVSYLINTFATKKSNGSLHIDGSYHEGKVLDDKEKHGIFEADEASVFNTLSTMLGLVEK